MQSIAACSIPAGNTAEKRWKGVGLERRLLYINKKEAEKDKMRKLAACAVMHGVKLETVTEEELGTLPEDAELLKLRGFGRDEVGAFLSALRRAGVRIDYKCVETERNACWTLRQLYEELRAEHEEMQRHGKAGQ